MQGGQALTQVAAAAASAGHDRQLEYELVRTMALLARDCPLTHSLGIDAWLRQLLYIAADAAAMKHNKLASQVAVDAWWVQRAPLSLHTYTTATVAWWGPVLRATETGNRGHGCCMMTVMDSVAADCA